MFSENLYIEKKIMNLEHAFLSYKGEMLIQKDIVLEKAKLVMKQNMIFALIQGIDLPKKQRQNSEKVLAIK